MAEIHRFSLIYDLAEDRIAWDTVDLEGATTRLWLTQRLCRNLVKALVPLLQTAVPPADRPRSSEQQAAVQSFEQSAAMNAFGKTPSVRAAPDATAGLVRVIRLKPNSKGVDLVFEFAPEASRTIGLPPASLRQTLAVLHRLWIAAGWSAEVWPAWIAETAPAAPSGAVN